MACYYHNVECSTSDPWILNIQCSGIKRCQSSPEVILSRILVHSKYFNRQKISINVVWSWWWLIDVLRRPLLCTWLAKWAERPPKVMKRSKRRNNHQLCPQQDSNTGGSDLCSNTLPQDHGGVVINSVRIYLRDIGTYYNIALKPGFYHTYVRCCR